MRSRPARLDRLSSIGLQQVFFTFCTFRRQRLFVDRDRVALVRLHFLQSCDDEKFAAIAYCFMPDHLHAIVTAIDDAAECYRMARFAKQRTAFHYRASFAGRLWQEGFFDRTLRAHDDVWGVARYVISNPVRAGLCSTPEDYEFWGSQRYSREELLEFVSAPRT